MKNCVTRYLPLFLIPLAGLLTACAPSTTISQYRFTGTVLDSNRQPLKGADVKVVFVKKFADGGSWGQKLFGGNTDHSTRVVTGADGLFDIEGRPLHHVEYNIIGMGLLWIFSPIIKLSSDMETYNDIKENMPELLAALMVQNPPPTPPPVGTYLVFSAPGSEERIEMLLTSHDRGKVRRMTAEGPLYYRDYFLGNVVLNTPGRKGSATEPGNQPTGKSAGKATGTTNQDSTQQPPVEIEEPSNIKRKSPTTKSKPEGKSNAAGVKSAPAKKPREAVPPRTNVKDSTEDLPGTTPSEVKARTDNMTRIPRSSKIQPPLGDDLLKH